MQTHKIMYNYNFLFIIVFFFSTEIMFAEENKNINQQKYAPEIAVFQKMAQKDDSINLKHRLALIHAEMPIGFIEDYSFMLEKKDDDYKLIMGVFIIHNNSKRLTDFAIKMKNSLLYPKEVIKDSRNLTYCLKYVIDLKDIDTTEFVKFGTKNRMSRLFEEVYLLTLKKTITEMKAEITRTGDSGLLLVHHRF